MQIDNPSLGTPASGLLTNCTNLPMAGGVLTPAINGFRLTLTSGTPVTTADVTGATTMYCCPYLHNQIALYDGAAWNVRSSSQFSLALGTLTSGKPYDVFCYDNAGTPTLEFLVWTNDSTRATALVYQDGVLVKSGAATRRYLGTFYTTSTTQTEDSYTKRYLWNYYNRVHKILFVTDAAATWTYSTAAWRQANNSAANAVLFMVGVAEDALECEAIVTNVATSGATYRTVAAGIGLDSTSAVASLHIVATISSLAGAGLTSRLVVHPSAGKHALNWLEYGGGGDTQTWSSSSGSGLQGIWRC